MVEGTETSEYSLASYGAENSGGKPRKGSNDSQPTNRVPPTEDVGFAREPVCGMCHKTFNLLRRRHHCRGCHVAVCKDCARKAIDNRRGDQTKPQWYCRSCIDEDEEIEAVGGSGSRTTFSKRLSFSSSSFSQPAVNTMASSAKFCIECGYELPPKVKFCIECGTNCARSQVLSPSNGSVKDSDPVRGSRTTSRGSTSSNLTIIEEEHKVDMPLVSEFVAGTEGTEETLLDPMLVQIQSENVKLRRRIEKLKQKVVEAERQRAETEVLYQRVLATTPTSSVNSPTPLPEVITSESSTQAGITVKEHPDYAKFFKLLSMGLPAEQVKIKMNQTGVDPKLLDTPDAMIGSTTLTSSACIESKTTLVKDDERYAKFFKLAKMGMPSEQIKLKMSAEGLDPNLLDTPEVPSTENNIDAPTSHVPITVKEDPEYEKFFKLVKMGMPLEQVKLKMRTAGLNADLLDTPDVPSPNLGESTTGVGVGGVLAGLPPRVEAVKLDPTALSATLASKLQRVGCATSKQPEEAALPKKDAVKPNVELRPLFWTRVPVNVVRSTIWMKLTDANTELDLDEMEWMFRKNPVESTKKIEDGQKRKDGMGKGNGETAAPLVLLFDPKRQQNVSIAIARIRMTATELKSAIYALDVERLPSELLNVLISISPTTEEQDLLKNYDGDSNLLGNVEKFFLELLTIPRYTQRIKCIRFKHQFESRILETQAQLDTLQAATDQINDSEKFRRVLEHILAIGNYLNGCTPRGGAYGFKLDTLTKLHTLKSVDPRVTLMNFLLRQLEEKVPDVIAFAGELPHIGEAKRLSLDQLRTDLSSYNTELAMLQGQVRAAKNDKIEEDQFYHQMAPFAQDATEVLEELGRDFTALESSYHEVLTSFGEDPRKVGPMEFFSIIEEFVNEFKKAYRMNQTKEYQAIFDAAREAREQARAALVATADADNAAQLIKEAQDREAKTTTSPSLDDREAEQNKGSDEVKVLYAQIISMITSWAQTHGDGESDKVADVVNEFKSASRNFGTNEITAIEFCNVVRALVGSKVTIRIIPISAKLLTNVSKRKELLIAFDQFSDQVRKEKEEKPKPSSHERKGKKRPMMLKLEDIEPVVGEAAQQLHKSILESVQQAFDGDAKKMKEFTSNARKYGSEQISSRDFYQYLTTSFEPDFVGRLVPDLARLLQDAEKRHALIRALCESAPGWEKFSGL